MFAVLYIGLKKKKNNIHRPNCFGAVGSFLALILGVHDH